MIVVSNTSPITNLAAIAQIDLLRQLYGSIVIPSAVYQELTSSETEIPGAIAVQTLQWISTQPVLATALVVSLQQELDPGEAEAIALAVELGADLLILDERRGYQVATRLGLKVQGVLGVLIAAKSRTLIPSVKPVLDDLIAIAGFWVAESLYDRILELVDEELS